MKSNIACVIGVLFGWLLFSPAIAITFCCLTEELHSPWWFVLGMIIGTIALASVCSMYDTYYNFTHIHIWKYHVNKNGYLARTCRFCGAHWANFNPLEGYTNYFSSFFEVTCYGYKEIVNRFNKYYPEIEAQHKKDLEEEERNKNKIVSQKKKCKYCN